MTMDRQALVTGATRLIGIVGDPVHQVRSPEVYNPRLAARGVKAVLIPLHVTKPTFDSSMQALKQLGNLAGLIFTVPFKERAAAFADEILPTGQQVGAVNVMRREPDGRWIADIFDGAGLVRGLIGIGGQPAGKRILLMGSGGAGRAIAMSLARVGARALTLYDRHPEKHDHLAADVRRFYPDCAVTAGGTITGAGHEIIINATPCGMYPGDGLPLPLGPLDAATIVFDIVPQPEVSPLMAYAAAAGCKTGGGKLMVAGQADAVLEFLGFGA